MRKLKITKNIFILFYVFLTIMLNAQTSIPSNFYGINGWMPNAVGGAPSASPGPTMTIAQGGPTYTNTNGELYNLTSAW